MIDWDEIARLTDLNHEYMGGVDRTSERTRKTGEVFTPTSLTISILKKMDVNLFAPGKSVIDPTCGDGQLLVPVKWLKVVHFGMTPEDAVTDLYGVDLMPDNVEICKQRLGGGNIYCDDMLEPKTKEVQLLKKKGAKKRDATQFVLTPYVKPVLAPVVESVAPPPTPVAQTKPTKATKTTRRPKQSSITAEQPVLPKGSNIKTSSLENPSTTVLERNCTNSTHLIPLISKKLRYGSTVEQALSTTWATFASTVSPDDALAIYDDVLVRVMWISNLDVVERGNLNPHTPTPKEEYDKVKQDPTFAQFCVDHSGLMRQRISHNLPTMKFDYIFE